jgi:cell division protein ZapE
MTPREHYARDLEKEGFTYDPSQEQVVDHLQQLYEAMIRDRNKPSRGLLGRFLKSSAAEPVRGLYLWGGVGRGKTYLMDVFYDALPFENKMRVHFHRFMRRVHRELDEFAGEKNPLQPVAKRLASEASIICFDEFFVSDITDAMLLGGLFEKLFARGVTLVATSNIPPDELYRNGLQRARFLPAIALIKQHTRVVNVDGGVDYRLRALEKAELYHSPLDDEADNSLRASFDSLAPEPGQADVSLEIEGRYLAVRYCADDVVWFDFSELCDGPRSQNDYIELAMLYHAVLISNVPRFTPEKDDQARRFINLVDEFYDRSVKLVLSAEVPLESLYAGQRLVFEFERTVSRLLEMQSHEYLARGHKP